MLTYRPSQETGKPARISIGRTDYTVGDEDVLTPDGYGAIVDLNPDGREQIGVQLYGGDIRYYSWRDVSF